MDAATAAPRHKYMSNNMETHMILIEARDTLMDLGLIDSQLDFSTRWLGKQPSYMSCVVARGQEPSAEALLALAGRVTREAMQMRRVFRHAEAAALDGLSAKVWNELLARFAGQPEAV